MIILSHMIQMDGRNKQYNVICIFYSVLFRTDNVCNSRLFKSLWHKIYDDYKRFCTRQILKNIYIKRHIHTELDRWIDFVYSPIWLRVMNTKWSSPFILYSPDKLCRYIYVNYLEIRSQPKHDENDAHSLS